MARRGIHGAPLVTLTNVPSATSDIRTVLAFHADGHILRNAYQGNRSVLAGWKQWAIVPIWGMGNMVEWYKSKGFQESEG